MSGRGNGREGVLREPWEAAVNELRAACRSAAEAHLAAAARVQDGETAGLLRDVARERSALVAALDRDLARAGELPEAPDPDEASLRLLLQRLRAALAADADAALLAERRSAEEALLARLDAALEAEPPEPLRARLARWRGRLDAARQRLAGGG